MIAKFALMLCPQPGCPKVSYGRTAKCPVHDIEMVRTIVSIEEEVRRREKDARAEGAKNAGTFEKLFSDMGGGRR